jgi:hypothetical protein
MTTSTAISAQGTKLEIGTGTGGAKTISAIQLGNPTILTLTAHGLAAGNVVALAGLTGTDAGLLNGKSLPINHITTNTVAVDVDTTGKTITAAGTATPVTYTTIGNVKSYSGFDGEASEIDVTHLLSSAKEYRLGLIDPGNLSFECDQDDNDAGQVAVLAAQVAGTIQNMKLTFSNGKVASFTAFVKKFTRSGGVDQVLKSQCDLRISGAVTIA